MSDYSIVEHGTGFTIKEEGDVVEVKVVLNNAMTGIEVIVSDSGEIRHRRVYGLYRYYDMCDKIVDTLALKWQPKNCGSYGKIIALKAWKRKKIGRIVGKRLHHQWERMLSMVPQVVVDVQRAVFAATFKSYDHLIADAYRWLYDGYIARDIISYRACAAMVGWAFDWVMDDPKVGFENWRACYAPGGTPYRSLNRTLMNLPGGIPVSLLPHMRTGILPRPIFNRVELIATLKAFERSNIGEGLNPNKNIIVHATANQIREAMDQTAILLVGKRPFSRARNIAVCISYIMDYPGRYGGNIVGLARRSREYHAQLFAGNIPPLVMGTADGDEKVTMPPIPLPNIEGVEFLDTVGAIWQEGVRMGHCVAAYAPYAVNGNSFLFHVEHDGYMATVEVGDDGRVRQSHGPGNEWNTAAEVGELYLSDWGRKFNTVRRQELALP